MKRLAGLLLIASVVVSLAVPAAARQGFPASVPLPDGFYPEGIAIGRGHEFYAGSLLDGAVYRGDLRTGDGDVLVAGTPGRVVAGIFFDQRSGLLWGVGSDSGSPVVVVYDGASGALVATIELDDAAFLNDLVVTRDAAFVTDSLNDVLWTIPLDSRGRPDEPPTALPLGGDFTFVSTGDLPINLNGIVATPDGSALVAVHSTLGVLYRIDPATGEATEIDLAGGEVPSGDGLVLRGRTLYVVQNFLNQVSVVGLAPDLSSGEVTEVITSELFRIPSTGARFGADLYVVNARFDVALPPFLGGVPMSVDYDVVRVPT
ncbi:MAG: superoxide dismutase [Acidimicrobiales bacterium]